MLKVTGSVFILIAGCGFGISNSFRMKKQLEQLISLQEMLYLLEGEIKHFKRPLPEEFMAAAPKIAQDAINSGSPGNTPRKVSLEQIIQIYKESL